MSDLASDREQAAPRHAEADAVVDARHPSGEAEERRFMRRIWFVMGLMVVVPPVAWFLAGYTSGVLSATDVWILLVKGAPVGAMPYCCLYALLFWWFARGHLRPVRDVISGRDCSPERMAQARAVLYRLPFKLLLGESLYGTGGVYSVQLGTWLTTHTAPPLANNLTLILLSSLVILLTVCIPLTFALIRFIAPAMERVGASTTLRGFGMQYQFALAVIGLPLASMLMIVVFEHGAAKDASEIPIRLIVALLILIVPVSLLAGGTISRNILRTIRAVDEIANTGDLQRRVPTPSADELGDLARAFNHVLATLEQTTASRDYVENRARRQAELAKLGQLVISGISLDALFAATTATIRRLLGMTHNGVLEHCPEDGTILLRAGFGWEDTSASPAVIPVVSGSQTEYTLERGESVIVEDVHNQTRFVLTPTLKRYNVVGGITVPIPGAERPFGMLAAYTDRPHSFSKDDVHFLEAVAAVLASAIARAAAESQLRTAAAVFETMADGVTITDMDGVIVDINKAATQQHGYTREELIGTMPVDKVLAAQEVAKFHQHIRDCSAGRLVQNCEYVARRKDGTDLPIVVSLAVMTAADGTPSGIIAVHKDITESKRAEAELRKSHAVMAEALEREQAASAELASAMKQLEAAKLHAESATIAKSEFLANMSHEIRTPMTAILGFTETLLDAELSDSERLNAVYTIRRNGEHLLQIINDILDISKIEAGRLETERLACSLARIVVEARTLMQVRADAKNLPLEIEFVARVPETIETDPTRLKQILVNLIGNAIKFTEVGHVRLVARFVEADGVPMMRFDVVDTGIGMNADQVERLFQPFTQADTSVTRKFGGTGLGLNISRRLAEALGGTITVESELGVGSTFTLTVATGVLTGVKFVDDPLSEAGWQDQAASAASIEDCRLECSILLAEDGPDNQRLIAHLLRKMGASVTVVENGRRAVEAALTAREAGDPFDVILMDMQMPVMDGYEAASTLRREGYEGPIIALTAHAMRSDREKCLQEGCDDYASKPIDRRQLATVILKYVSVGVDRSGGA